MPAEEVYILLDGDDVGAWLENAVWQDDVRGYVQRSTALTEHFRELAESMTEAGATVLVIGGDSILARAHAADADRVIYALENRGAVSDVRVSVGIGDSLSRAHVALRRAKTSGKSQVVQADAL